MGCSQGGHASPQCLSSLVPLEASLWARCVGVWNECVLLLRICSLGIECVLLP